MKDKRGKINWLTVIQVIAVVMVAAVIVIPTTRQFRGERKLQKAETQRRELAEYVEEHLKDYLNYRCGVKHAQVTVSLEDSVEEYDYTRRKGVKWDDYVYVYAEIAPTYDGNADSKKINRMKQIRNQVNEAIDEMTMEVAPAYAEVMQEGYRSWAYDGIPGYWIYQKRYVELELHTESSTYYANNVGYYQGGRELDMWDGKLNSTAGSSGSGTTGSYAGGSSGTINSDVSGSGLASSSSGHRSDPYDVYDYDCADDFADDWADEFGDGDWGDGWDDAWDYFYEHH